MRLPILMFHKVAETPAGARYPGNYVRPALFDELLARLTAWGYESVTIEQWLDWRVGRGKLPMKPIALTFDDGYRSNADIAWPILQRRGMGATIFVVTDLLGATNRWDVEEIQEPLLSADDVRLLRREGLHFGSHTRTHAALTTIGRSAALEELRGSRLALEQALGEPVRVVCYPYSKQDSTVRGLAADAGYEGAVRGGGGTNSPRRDPFALQRIKIDNSFTFRRLRSRMSWLSWLGFR